LLCGGNQQRSEPSHHQHTQTSRTAFWNHPLPALRTKKSNLKSMHLFLKKQYMYVGPVHVHRGHI